MASRGYDVVVDVDTEGDDLGHTDLQDDNLVFHNSDFDAPSTNPLPSTSSNIPPSSNKSLRGKLPPQGSSFLPTSTSNPSNPPSSSSAQQVPKNKSYLWTLPFYAQFFDVDTAEVLRRCTSALFPRTNFLDILDGNPDLYGPFWIATTVVMILFLTGSISEYLASVGKEHYVYNWKLLSGAAGLVYGYTFILPVGLWAVLKWFGAGDGANVLECWALYGYANLIWIPVALASWSPLTILNYVFVAVGFTISAVFLFRNLYPVLSATDVKTSKILLVAVVVLHAGLAIAIKYTFFANKHSAGKKSSGDTKDDKNAMVMLW